MFSLRKRRYLANKIDCLGWSTRDTTVWALTKPRLEAILNFYSKNSTTTNSNKNYHIHAFERNSHYKAMPDIDVDILVKSDNSAD